MFRLFFLLLLFFFLLLLFFFFFFFFQAEDGIRDVAVTGVQTCALPICTCGPGFYNVGLTPGTSCSACDVNAVDTTTSNNLDCECGMGFYSVGPNPGTSCSACDVNAVDATNSNRSEERRVGKESRSRWWPYH